jgi:flagellar export protein FliJ
MKSLATLIKLQKNRVDEQRIHVARLQTHLSEIEQKIAQLEIDKAREQVAAQKSVESTVTYGAFLKAAVKKGRDLEKDRQVAEAAVEVARGQLTELFEEQKRYETAEANRITAEEKEERRRETIELDEVGGMSHERRKDKH